MTLIPRGIVLVLLLAPVRVLAEAGPTPAAQEKMPAAQEKLTLERFGVVHPACREWTDGCAVCLRHDDKPSIACSLPGIACEPREIVCRDPPPRTPSATPPTPKRRDP